MPCQLALRHPGGTTPIFVGGGALEMARAGLDPWLAGRALFVLSTPRVLALHGALIESLRPRVPRLTVLEVEDGEAAKSLERAGSLWADMLAGGGKRDSRLITFGGGSVGDLGGFVAGCFLRGIEYAQFPTTLLAQVDASIGGKTAIDLPLAKNSVGLFHHPSWVVSDGRWLVTLPPEEIRSGLVEAIKMAAVLDLDLLSGIEVGLEEILAGSPPALEGVVAAGAAAKIAVVESDPDERGARALLNFGHTLGHAIEAALGYQGLRHGEAVAYGILFALRLASRRGLDPEFAARVRVLILRLGLPALPALDAAGLEVLMGRDKKAREGSLDWVLPVAAGRGEVVTDLPRAEVAEELQRFLAAPGLPT
ncbi:MAG: 3-dehydroquinate synthase family protein [Acidobacteriota bacterium]